MRTPSQIREDFRQYRSRVAKLHSGRSPLKLALYLGLLLILVPFSLTLDFISNGLTYASEAVEQLNDKLNKIAEPVKKWAETRKSKNTTPSRKWFKKETYEKQQDQ